MKKIELNKVGADIEVFIKNTDTNEVVNAAKFIKGTKEKPFNFDESNEFYATSLDNVMAEFCIPPADTVNEFVNGINKSLDYIKSILPNGFEILASPAERLRVKYLRSKNAVMFGCEPDFNAYDKEVNIKPWCNDPLLRTCGAHIHISYNNPTIEFNNNIYSYKVDEERSAIVKVMDLFLGIPAVIMEPDNNRKELYGKAGAFRPKPYGLEYRTLSNFYLASDELKKWAFESVKSAIDFLNNNQYKEEFSDLIRQTIDNADKESAKSIINEFNLKVV